MAEEISLYDNKMTKIIVYNLKNITFCFDLFGIYLLCHSVFSLINFFKWNLFNLVVFVFLAFISIFFLTSYLFSPNYFYFISPYVFNLIFVIYLLYRCSLLFPHLFISMFLFLHLCFSKLVTKV